MRTARSMRIACPILVSLLLANAATSSPTQLGVEETEALVRTVWYEGLPFEEAERIGPEGAAVLAQLLADPSESTIHANALLALGISGQPGAWEAIAAWAAIPRRGELDRDAFRAWQVLPHALGHLARRDPRALTALAERLAGETVSWRFRHFDAERLREMGCRETVSALGASGLAQAHALLSAARGDGGGTWQSHVDAALVLHARVRARGAAGVFDSRRRFGGSARSSGPANGTRSTNATGSKNGQGVQ